MSIFRWLDRLATIGFVLSKFGQLLMNLGSAPSTTELVKDGASSQVDQQSRSQDSSNSNGDEDEEPEVNEGGVQTGQGDLFETPKPE